MITRFAPSPTGDLHLGHVAHAQWLWNTAREHDATVIIRMEDHDRSRCAPEFERSILKDIRWLGFVPESRSLASLATRGSAYRQSDHPERYRVAFDLLRQRADVYGCTCTRSMMSAPDANGERCYGGTCRGQPIQRDGRRAVRVAIPDEEVRFTDLRHGEVVQRPARTSGDIAIIDAEGQWTYQFCVVVDDLHDNVDLIVRGDDLLSSTGRQWLLARMLGRATPPLTLHHPLLYAANGSKLSKRDKSETVKSLRRSGVTAKQILTRAGAHY